MLLEFHYDKMDIDELKLNNLTYKLVTIFNGEDKNLSPEDQVALIRGSYEWRAWPVDWRSVATNNDSRRNPIPTRPRPLRHLMRRGPIHAVAVRQTARGGVYAQTRDTRQPSGDCTRPVSITKVTNASDNPATAGSEAVAAQWSQLSGTLKRSRVPELPGPRPIG